MNRGLFAQSWAPHAAFRLKPEATSPYRKPPALIGWVASAFRRKILYRRPSSVHTPGIIAAAMQILMMSAGRNG
jgi:hypothetical protein